MRFSRLFFPFTGNKVRFRTSLAVPLLFLVSCVTPVAGGLSEEDAKRVIVALERNNVDTSKEPDPAVEAHFQVMVSREEVARAASILQDEELPPRATLGVLDAVGKSSLVPSSLVEHAQYIAGMAGDLERTLLSIDGIIAARVHLSVPAPNPMEDKPAQPPSASVLIKYRGATPPLEGTSVQSLIAGAIAGLRSDDVTVILVPRPHLPMNQNRQMAHFGPLSVTRSSLPFLRYTSLGLLVTSFALLFVLGRMWQQLRKLQLKN